MLSECITISINNTVACKSCFHCLVFRFDFNLRVFEIFLDRSLWTIVSEDRQFVSEHDHCWISRKHHWLMEATTCSKECENDMVAWMIANNYDLLYVCVCMCIYFNAQTDFGANWWSWLFDWLKYGTEREPLNKQLKAWLFRLLSSIIHILGNYTHIALDQKCTHALKKPKERWACKISHQIMPPKHKSDHFKQRLLFLLNLASDLDSAADREQYIGSWIGISFFLLISSMWTRSHWKKNPTLAQLHEPSYPNIEINSCHSFQTVDIVCCFWSGWYQPLFCNKFQYQINFSQNLHKWAYINT